MPARSFTVKTDLLLTLLMAATVQAIDTVCDSQSPNIRRSIKRSPLSALCWCLRSLNSESRLNDRYAKHYRPILRDTPTAERPTGDR